MQMCTCVRVCMCTEKCACVHVCTCVRECMLISLKPITAKTHECTRLLIKLVDKIRHSISPPCGTPLDMPCDWKRSVRSTG